MPSWSKTIQLFLPDIQYIIHSFFLVGSGLRQYTLFHHLRGVACYFALPVIRAQRSFALDRSSRQRPSDTALRSAYISWSLNLGS